MFDFSNRVVIVTGGTGALGGDVARAFHKAGAKLVIPDRSMDRLPGLFPELVDPTQHFLASGIDITQPDAAQKMVDESLQRFGQIDILVNTIGGYRGGQPTHETSLEAWDFMMNLNARTQFLVCLAVLPAMLARQSGKIVNVASGAALKGGANASAYSASKGAVVRLTESMAEEYKLSGININAVLPGTFDTPQNRQGMSDADFSRWVPLAALTNVILFLASDEASALQGALIPVFGKN